MLRKYLILLFLLISTVALWSQPPTSLLWEISGNGINRPSYLFGTIHIIKKDEFFITGIMKEKLKQSQAFITEVDMNIPILKQLSLMNEMYLPDNKTIRDYISPDDYISFAIILIDSLKISQSKFSKYIRLKPFFASALLIKDMIGEIKAYERELYKIAKNKGIPTDGLETIEFQLSLVNATPLKEQAQALVDEVKDYKHLLTEYNDMVAIYKKQDLDTLYNMIVNDSTADSEFNREFIYKRNIKWIPLIEERIKQYGCFIAVGGAHLPGQQGIIALLRGKGYTLTPIK